jgi:hypothetical protein
VVSGSPPGCRRRGRGARGRHVGVFTGVLAIDLGLGCRTRAPGPQSVKIDAPREAVLDVVAAGYLMRQPKALTGKIRVLERGSDMVLAALWADLVADRWEQAVAASLEAIKAEAERRGSVGAATSRL